MESPSFKDQLLQARLLLRRKGIEAVRNPHALIGRMCRCNDCFCCAARRVWREAQAYQIIQEKQS